MIAVLVAFLVFFMLAPTPVGAYHRGRGQDKRNSSASKRNSSARLLAVAQIWVATCMRRSNSTEIVPQALELLARYLRSGASLRTAIDAVAADYPESGFTEVSSQVHGGMSLSSAIDRWAVGSADRQTAAALLVLGHTSGAAMASSLDRAAASIRQRQALSDEIRALTSQTRMSSLVVALAPVGFGAIMASVDREALQVLFTTPVGLISLLTGLILECLGVWWMSRLSNRVGVWA